MNNNKKKGIIYKIEVGNDLYVGSTKCYYLCDRQSTHNYDYKNNKYVTKLLHIKAKENNIDKLKCIFISNFYYDTVDELRQEEQKYIIELNANLNVQKAYTKKEETKEKQKHYELEHKEQRKKYRKEYREKNKKHYKEYREKNKEHYKEYRKNNEDKLKQQKKEYYENNKEELKQKQIVKVKCEFCNCEIQKRNLKEHEKTKKCLNNRD